MIDSPLPQLGREFDYKIPAGVEVEVGQPVLVPFGRQAKPKTAVITQLAQTSDYATAEITETLGPRALSSGFLDYVKAVAKRQAISPGEVLRMALTSMPKRKGDFIVKATPIADWVLENLGGEIKFEGHRADIVEPKQHLITGKPHPEWAIRTLRSALSAKGSALVNIADHRQLKRFKKLVQQIDIDASLFWAEDFKTPAKRYWLQQHLLNHGGILVGSRVAMMMDLKDLERIIVVNDLDPSHESESSPYLATRELAFIRAEAQHCQVHIISHVPSAEVLRLAEMEFLKIKTNTSLPRISFGSESQISTQKLIGSAIANGPVLIVTSFAGDSAVINCQVCRSAGRCSNCGGSIYMPSAETYRCRTCQSLDKPVCVSCGSQKFVRGSKGSSRTAADFGKMIPGIRVVESSQNKQVETVSGRVIVVATPGAIPDTDDGYQLAVVDQPQSFLSRESLRALEHSLRIWCDMASHLEPDGQLHFANYQGDVVKKLSIGQFTQLVKTESDQRKALGLSPWRRLGIIEGEQARLNDIADKLTFSSVVATSPRLVFSYQYKDGPQVAEILLKEQLATPPLEGNRRKRGLKVILDGQGLI
jgi:primosomal protein N' (replication factor Y)